MNALFWKDVRINRFPLIVVAVFLIVPYAIMAAIPFETGMSYWPRLFIQGSAFGFAGCYISLALLGGCIIATERADRSAEFLAYLPPSKRQILTSKGILLVGTAVVMTGWNLTATALGLALMDPSEMPGTSAEMMGAMAGFATIGIAAAGTGWFASSMFASTGGPVGLALLLPIVISIMLSASSSLLGWPNEDWLQHAIFIACGTLGVTLFILGCVNYLRRVEP